MLGRTIKKIEPKVVQIIEYFIKVARGNARQSEQIPKE